MVVRNLIELSLAEDGEAVVICYRGRLGLRRRRVFRNAAAAAMFAAEHGVVGEPRKTTVTPAPTARATTPV